MKKPILPLLCLCLFSCTQRGDILSQYSVSRNIDEAQETRIDLRGAASPLAMLATGDYVVLAQDKAENMLAVYNTETGQAQHLLPRGHGENEVLDVHQMQARDATSFYVFDLFSKKLLTIGLGTRGAFEIRSQEKAEDYLSLAIDSDTLLVGNCVETDFRYKIHGKGKEKRLGSYEDFGLAPNVGKILLQGNILNDHSAERFAWLSFYGTAWQIVSYKTPAEVVETRIFDQPQFQTQEGGAQPMFDAKTKIGFISATTGHGCIYALYAGHTLEEAAEGKGNAMTGGDIFVLDWNGEVKGRMHTTERVAHIAYNKEKRRLYLLCDDSTGFRIKYISL